MPIERQHGGAAIARFPLTAPGFKGLNTQVANAVIGPEWATKLQNAVIDGSGRLAARKGWTAVTTSAIGAEIVRLHEFAQADGTVKIMATTATAVYESTDGGQTFSDVTGTAAFTSGDWYLVNFNDYMLGFQSGEAILVYNGTTSSQVADVNCPSGGAGCAAFGRVWAVDSDGVNLKYSALLDHTDWTSSDSGSFDLSNVWQGTDTVKAVIGHNGSLVVFGQHNILIYIDGSGSTVGIDPTQMYLVDSIIGIGCASQESVVPVGGDIWFLGNDYNLHSMARIVQEKSAPIHNLTTHISDDLRDSITLTTHDISDLRAYYSPQDRFYLLSLPAESSAGVGDEIGMAWVFDTRGQLEDGTARVLGKWDGNVPIATCVRASGTVLSALRTVTGKVGSYSGQTDNGETYTFDYESGWIDLTQQGYLLMLKRIKGVFFINTNTDCVLKWGFDFQTTLKTQSLVFDAGSVGAEYGIGEWGIGEFSGGVTLNEKKAAGRGTGEYIKLGAQAIIDGGEFAMQQLEAFAKVGRLK